MLSCISPLVTRTNSTTSLADYSSAAGASHTIGTGAKKTLDLVLGISYDHFRNANVRADYLNVEAHRKSYTFDFMTELCKDKYGIHAFLYCDEYRKQKEIWVPEHLLIQEFIAADFCANGILDKLETDVDCGGTGCNPCWAGKKCTVHEDCETGICNHGTCTLTWMTPYPTPQPGPPTPPTSVPLPTPVPTANHAHCFNGKQDGDETDSDCGGSCRHCDVNKECLAWYDCKTSICNRGQCSSVPTPHPTQKPTPSFCVNGKKDGDETDKNCGGSCHGCEVGKICLTDEDCFGSKCDWDPLTPRVQPNSGICGTRSPTAAPTSNPAPIKVSPEANYPVGLLLKLYPNMRH
jgi:hypothetical protein